MLHYSTHALLHKYCERAHQKTNLLCTRQTVHSLLCNETSSLHAQFHVKVVFLCKKLKFST